MSFDHDSWSLTPSTLIPMILQLRRSNSGLSPATLPNSVVQTGVKSLGCEKSSAQPSQIHSWKLIAPRVVSAEKSGATSLIRSDIACLLILRLAIEATLRRSRFAINGWRRDLSPWFALAAVMPCEPQIVFIRHARLALRPAHSDDIAWSPSGPPQDQR